MTRDLKSSTIGSSLTFNKDLKYIRVGTEYLGRQNWLSLHLKTQGGIPNYEDILT